MFADRPLEDVGFFLVGRITLRRASGLKLDFHLRTDARQLGPAIYALRIGREVVRMGKVESALIHRMKGWERDVSRALAGEYHKGGTTPWEALQWQRRLGHANGEILAQFWSRNMPLRALRSCERKLIRYYDPPLCNDSPCGRMRPPEMRRVNDVAATKKYWQRLKPFLLS